MGTITLIIKKTILLRSIGLGEEFKGRIPQQIDEVSSFVTGYIFII
jgi:hypothetical protein